MNLGDGTPKALRIYMEWLWKNQPLSAPPPMSNEEIAKAAAQWVADHEAL